MERFKIIPACYLVLIKENKVLLSKRKNTGFMDGKYGLPSGHLEGDETLKQTMAREAKEEIDITLNLEDLELIHVMHRSKKESDWERIDFFMTAGKWTGEIKNAEPDKCGDLDWFSLKELPDEIIPYIKEVLLNIEKRIIYSEYGFGE